MNKRIRQVSYFLFSQYFSDGLRTTLSILLPSLVWVQFGQLQTGLAMSLGALNVSLSDAPGPVRHRRNAMVVTALIGFVVTFITGFARMNPYFLAAGDSAVQFFFSMFAIWGNRAASVGTAALLIMILMLDRPLNPAGVMEESRWCWPAVYGTPSLACSYRSCGLTCWQNRRWGSVSMRLPSS